MDHSILIWIVRGTLDIAALGCIGLAVGHYRKKGLIEVLFHAFRLVLCLFLAKWLYPYAADVLKELGFTKGVADHFLQVLDSSALGDSELLQKLPLPEFIKNSAALDVESLVQSGLTSFKEGIAQWLAGFTTNLLAMLIVFVLSLLVTVILGRCLRIVDHIPVLHGVNAMLGGIIGLGMGVLLVWLLGLTVYLVACYAGLDWLLEAQTQAWLLGFADRFNPLLKAARQFLPM